MREMTSLHPVDVTRLLQTLVRDSFLETHNSGRGAVYCLPGAAIPRPEEVFGADSALSPSHSEHLDHSSTHLPVGSAHLRTNSGEDGEVRDARGRLITEQLDAPVIDSLDLLSLVFRRELEALATEPRTRGKLSTETMKTVVLSICRGHYITLSCLAELVNRDPDAFRQQHLKPLARAGLLKLAFPTAPTHAKQAYCSAE